jgi:hypothetical protein
MIDFFAVRCLPVLCCLRLLRFLLAQLFCLPLRLLVA